MRTVIIGAGGHGKVVLDILLARGEAVPVGFIDADPRLIGKTIAGLPVLGPATQLYKLVKSHRLKAAIIAIGDNTARSAYMATIIENHLQPITAIHPSAVVAPSAKIGAGCVITANAVICPDASLGDGVIVNTAASIDHECEVGNWVHICPGARLAGRVRVGDGAFIGMGANVIQCLSIGEGATIGAGAVVLKDVSAGATAVGVPARIVKGRSMAAYRHPQDSARS